jgi:hypothetical protein
MTINFPGPYEIRIKYTATVSSVTLTHTQRLSCAIAGDDPGVGDGFDVIDVGRRAGGAIGLDAAIDAWIDLVVPFYSGTGATNFVSAELWKYAAGTYDASFVSTYAIGEAGTNGGGVQQAAQSIVTFRSSNGGIFKLSFMESALASGGTDTGTISSAALEALVASVEDGDHPWLARDDGFPIVRIAHFPGQNEALFKKRFRPAI